MTSLVGNSKIYDKSVSRLQSAFTYIPLCSRENWEKDINKQCIKEEIGTTNKLEKNKKNQGQLGGSVD